MSKRLHISEDLSLPIDAATQTFAFIARKGAGKTYAAGKLAECLMDAGVQVVILDSVGNWWGLRLNADGKTPAYDVPVLGGLRGDIPLEATGGRLIAETIVETGRSLIVDVSQFSKGDRQKFATELGERLWLKKKAERHPSPVHIIIEESQLIVPESVRSDSARMVGIYEEIIRLGRNYGIGVSMISQRPQSVNKEVLNQTECLFALQVNGKHERDALRGWIVHQGMDRGLVDELPALPIGTAYVWSPQWLQILQKVKIAPKKTFDASATPKVGSHQVRRDLKPLQLDDLKERMTATIEKAKAEDPKELRKQIAELKKQIAAKTSAPAKPIETIKKVETLIVKDAQIKRLESFGDKLATVGTQLLEASKEITAAISKAGTNGHKPAVAQRLAPVARALPDHGPAPIPRTASAREAADSDGDLVKGAMKILRSVVQFGRVTRSQITLLTGYTQSSRDTYLHQLSSRGLVSYPGRGEVEATELGIEKAGHVEVPPTGDDLVRWWLGRLPAGQAKIFEAVVSGGGNPVTRQWISEQTGYTQSSRDTYLHKLKTVKLITIPSPGTIAPAEFLFQ